MNRALSPRELVAFEAMLLDDMPAAQALCFAPPPSARPDAHEARARALTRLDEARKRDERARAA